MDQSRNSFLSRLAKVDAGRGPVIRRRFHPEVANVPRFLRPRPQGGWAQMGRPVRIRGFDLQEDILAVSIPADVTMPSLTLEQDHNAATTTLRANGFMIARVYEAPQGITLRHVRVASFASS